MASSLPCFLSGSFMCPSNDGRLSGSGSPGRGLCNAGKQLTTRRRLRLRLFCSAGGVPPVDSSVDDLYFEHRVLCATTSLSIVALKSYFSGPENGLVKCQNGTGTFVDPTLIVTSAHAVGRVHTDRSSTTLRHSCEIGRTFAITTALEEVLSARVLAVNFGGDVAVLEAEAEGYSWIEVAKGTASRELPLLLITSNEMCSGREVMEMKDRSKEEMYDVDSGRSEWPYPVGDEYEWTGYGRGLDGGLGLHITPGSPWMSFDGEIVGITSAAAGKEAAGSYGGFVVPPLRIRSLLEYAKKKDPHDPVVVDPWITSHTISDAVFDKEHCFGKFEIDSVTTVYDSFFGYGTKE